MNVSWKMLTSMALMSWLTVGCSQQAPHSNDSAPGQTAQTEKEHAHDHDHGSEGHGHKHGEWWCDEHGVPEEICALCNSKVAAEFQKKGDWCKEHERPDSQCFVCHPEKFDEFAAKYEAKYGKKPPKPKS